jgi:hypothetical protein
MQECTIAVRAIFIHFIRWLYRPFKIDQSACNDIIKSLLIQQACQVLNGSSSVQQAGQVLTGAPFGEDSMSTHNHSSKSKLSRIYFTKWNFCYNEGMNSANLISCKIILAVYVLWCIQMKTCVRHTSKKEKLESATRMQKDPAFPFGISM